MPSLPRAIIHRKKVDAVQRFHPWIFSGAIAKLQGEVKDGDLVEAYSEDGKFLALGLWGLGSIAIKVLSFSPVETIQQLLRDRLSQAYRLRKQLGLISSTETNCYRLVNSEGDGLPSLIIDIYGDTAVLQCHSFGTYRYRMEIAEALIELYEGDLVAVYDKSAATLSRKSQSQSQDGLLIGDRTSDSGEVLEYGHRFIVDWERGQKTGFFIDQRENRAILGRYAKGKKILNTFCYSGGFSLQALYKGASIVHSLDSSKKAIALTEENILLNTFKGKHACIVADAMEYLKEVEEAYDIIVIDPPAFAKHRDKRHQAIQGYKRLNAHVFRQIKPGGIIFTFSCSQVVDKQLFTNTIIAAAIEAGRNIRILEQLHQPADHPISAFHPEGEYLKGLILQVE